MASTKIIFTVGIDLGGTKVNVGLIDGDNNLVRQQKEKIPTNCKDEFEVINLIIDLTKRVIQDCKIRAIGVGVPSILDRKKGIIHEVQNIPSWKEVPLAKILTETFNVPVCIDNDANCFALGEHYFGAGKDCQNMVGLTLGTGLGSGIITNGELMGDANGGSGEFGMMPYLDGIVEDYCSGKFFKRECQTPGEFLFLEAQNGEKEALEKYNAFGTHLGNAVKLVLFAVDPEKIIIGGSIAQAAPLFDKALRKSVSSFSYKKTLESLEIVYSNTPNIAILGAAALTFTFKKNRNYIV